MRFVVRSIAVLWLAFPVARAGAQCRYETPTASTSASGQFTTGASVVGYQSVVPTTGTARVTLEIDQLVLTASIDFVKKTAELDGQITGTRKIADLTDSDSSALAAFARDVNDCL